MYTKDIVDFITRVESGEILDEAELADGFQLLINSGLAWNLQGSYGRLAMDLIERGLCTPPSPCDHGQCGSCGD